MRFMIKNNLVERAFVVFLLVIISALSVSSANINSCGPVSENSVLISDISASSVYACLNITANNIVLDGNGHELTYVGSSDVYGIDMLGHSGVEIKNFGAIINFRTGILASGSNSRIFNNTITAGPLSGEGIFTFPITQNLNITNNVFNGSSDESYEAVYLTSSKNVLVDSNNINVSSMMNAQGIFTAGPTDCTYSNNNISTTGFNYATGIVIYGNRSLLLNNNIFVSGIGNKSILDQSIGSMRNYIVYNNSYGEIRWTNTTGFLSDLTVFGNISLGGTVQIGSNAVALDVAEFGALSKINDSANITLRGLGLAQVDQIRRIDGFSSSDSYIQTNGADCVGTTCNIIGYISGTLIFNTTTFSSFSGYDAPAGALAGSIEIRGINGTVITGSRSVMLDLQYESGNGIDSCRFANDAEADLASAPWEPCIDVKSWLLSASEGNKTVYFQVRDKLSNIQTYNDSILYRFMQDYTAPTAPIVYDGNESDDADWSNSNTSLLARWFNSTEDISTIYYAYRILNNSACFGSCDFVIVNNAASVIVNDLYLAEGRNFSFEVYAFNPSYMNSTIVSSDGVVIDITSPNAVGINSSTHPLQTVAYPLSTALFNFSAEDPIRAGVSSGIKGYSYVLDRHAGTAPDNILEQKPWDTLVEMHKGTYNQSLKINGSGSSDYAYALFSQIKNNITVNDSIRLKVALAELVSDYADLMGLKIYLMRVTQGSAISGFNMESAAVSNIVNISSNIKYAENMADAQVYVFDLVANMTVDDNSNDIYIVISGIPTDDNNRNVLAIGGTTNPVVIDSSTRNFVCSELDVCFENTTQLEYAISVQRRDFGSAWVVEYPLLSDGTYYFHAKAMDNAGNWGISSHYRFIVEAGGISSLVTDPFDEQIFKTNASEINITVRVSVGSNASVRVIAKHPGGGSNDTSEVKIAERTAAFENVTLKLGRNEIYAQTNTTGGTLANSRSIFVTVSADPFFASNKTLKVRYGSCSASSLPYLCNSAESSAYVGIATENSGSVAAPFVQADTSVNSMKIYATRPFDLELVAADLQKNDFLDRINPLFGFVSGANEFVLRSELKYYDIYLGGGFSTGSGTHNLFIRKGGDTIFGQKNITIELD